MIVQPWTDRDKLPKGAKILSEREAFDMVMNQIFKHEPVKDVWILKFGGGMAGALASLSGFVMLRHFRRALSMTVEARVSSFLPCVFLTSIGAFGVHTISSIKPVVLQQDICFVCHQLKTACVQCLVGFVLPFFMSSTIACMTAFKLGVNVPGITDFREFMQFTMKMVKLNNGSKQIAGCLVANFFGAMLIIHAEGMQMFTFKKRLEVRQKLAQQEQEERRRELAVDK